MSADRHTHNEVRGRGNITSFLRCVVLLHGGEVRILRDKREQGMEGKRELRGTTVYTCPHANHRHGQQRGRKQTSKGHRSRRDSATASKSAVHADKQGKKRCRGHTCVCACIEQHTPTQPSSRGKQKSRMTRKRNTPAAFQSLSMANGCGRLALALKG